MNILPHFFDIVNTYLVINCRVPAGNQLALREIVLRAFTQSTFIKVKTSTHAPSFKETPIIGFRWSLLPQVLSLATTKTQLNKASKTPPRARSLHPLLRTLVALYHFISLCQAIFVNFSQSVKPDNIFCKLL